MNCNIYPSYHEIKAAKEECNYYKGKIPVSKSLIEVKMQVLMDTTDSRIIKDKKITVYFVLKEISKEFFVISKWVCDVSTGQSGYKQRSLEDASDSDIFTTSVVPLKLYSIKISGD
jgi:hypothetical protein